MTRAHSRNETLFAIGHKQTEGSNFLDRFSTEENRTNFESFWSRWLVVTHEVRHVLLCCSLYCLRLAIERSEKMHMAHICILYRQKFWRYKFPCLNSGIFKIHFRTVDHLCVCTDFRVDKHTCALSFYLRTSSIRFNRERKSYVFRNSHEKKICLYFKIVFMYGNSRLVLLVCLESQFKFINRLLCNNLLRY